MSVVLADLARLGYSAQWDLIPAFANGAPHLRHRVWIVAYPDGARVGPVFARPPWRFPWPVDPAIDGSVPRLSRGVPDRRERLTRLGNAVVPQAVASLWINVTMALGAEPLEPPRLMPDPWPEKFPNAGALIRGHVFALPTSSPSMKELRAWPTPAASESSWGLDAIKACVDANGEPARDPHKRFYHPETGQIVQRTLDTYVKGAEAGLWPTPLASDHRSGSVSDATLEGNSRPLREHVVAVERGKWPTPIASDSRGSRRRTARTAEWTSTDGETLLDAALLQHEAETGERLWPTPKASPSGPDFARLERARKDDGRKGSGGDDLVTAVVRDETGRTREAERLWNTPTAAPWSHGGGGGGELVREIKEEQGEKIGGWSRNGDAPSDPGRSLEPRWVEWLMGYPTDWTNPDAGGPE